METSRTNYYTDPSLSALHHALRATRRRLIIALVLDQVATSDGYLLPQAVDAAETMKVSPLARGIVAIEQDVPVDSATGAPYHNAYTALIQTHLPELNRLGVIQYEPNRKRIRPDRNFAAMATVAAISSPIAIMFFDESISNHSLGGPPSCKDSDSTGN